MTKRAFEALAAALRETRPPLMDPLGQFAGIMRRPDMEQWQADIEAIAGVLADQNPRFDEARFMGACQEED